MPTNTTTAATSSNTSAHDIVSTALARRVPSGTEVVPASRRRTPRKAAQPATVPTPAPEPAPARSSSSGRKSATSQAPALAPRTTPAPTPTPATAKSKAGHTAAPMPEAVQKVSASATHSDTRRVSEREVKAALVQVNNGRAFWTAYNAFGSARNSDEISQIKEAAVAGILTAYSKSGVDAETFAAAAGIPLYALERFIGGMTAGGLVFPAAEKISRKLGLFGTN